MKAPQARIGFVQTSPTFGEIERNLDEAGRSVAGAPPFDVLVLPELFATGYLFRDREEALDLAGRSHERTLQALRTWAEERSGWIAAGFAEMDGDQLYNSAALVGPDGSTFVYRKVHLFDREKLVFDPGAEAFEAWSIEIERGTLRVGVMICFDWVFPESARTLALDGAEVILHPSNLVLDPCQDAMITRCLENRVFAVTANRAGRDDRGAISLGFTGRSQTVTPRGEVLERSPAGGSHVAVHRVNLEEARDKKFTERNELLRDRRPDTYRGIA